MASQQLFGPSSYKETIHDSIPISFQIGEEFSVRFNEVPLFYHSLCGCENPDACLFWNARDEALQKNSCNFIIIVR